MNLPSASPNENMKIDSSISPMPARRAERSSAKVESFPKRFNGDCGIASGAFRSGPGALQAFHLAGFKAVDARAKPGHDESGGLPRHWRCDTDRRVRPLEKPAMTEFDPAAHRMVPQQRWFEDFTLGERFVIPGRTMTTAVFAAFQIASGDTHPVHYDVEYCRARDMPNLLAHGFQTLIHTAPGGGLFPFLVEESLVGFLEQSSRFLKPVFADDTIYPALEVAELTPRRTTGMAALRSTDINQRRELVLEALHTFVIHRRPV